MTDTLTDSYAGESTELARRVDELERQLAAKSSNLSMVVFSGELDKLLAAFTIATGAAACGMQVSMFFTFWATSALKQSGKQAGGKSLVERMFGWMLPGGFHRQKLSRLDMLGAGRWMMAQEMQRKNVPSLKELVAMADELGVEFNVCEMSMSLMGIHCEEMIPLSDIKYCGVATFLERARSSSTTLFI